MSTEMILTPNVQQVQLTLDQLLTAIRQLDADARSTVAQVLLADEMDERFARLIKRLANKRPATDISDAEINAEIYAVRDHRVAHRR